MTWTDATIIVSGAIMLAGIIGTAWGAISYTRQTVGDEADIQMRDVPALTHDELRALNRWLADSPHLKPAHIKALPDGRIGELLRHVPKMADYLQSKAAQLQREADWLRKELKRRKV